MISFTKLPVKSGLGFPITFLKTAPVGNPFASNIAVGFNTEVCVPFAVCGIPPALVIKLPSAFLAK